MNCRSLLASAALALVPAMPALAADYSPPIYIDQAPEYVPVEIGTGWYLRGDVSLNVDRPVYQFTLFGQRTDNNRLGGSLGVGYHFSDLLRAELNAGLIMGDRYTYNDGVDSLTTTFRAWTGMANAYFDLGTIAGITPYVGAGVGLMHARHRIVVDAPSLGATGLSSGHQTEFAYSLGAGVNYKVAANTSVDLGYQYLSSPRMRYLDTNTFAERRGVDYHQIKLGLRYDLW